jgi:hypothetical protein
MNQARQSTPKPSTPESSSTGDENLDKLIQKLNEYAGTTLRSRAHQLDKQIQQDLDALLKQFQEGGGEPPLLGSHALRSPDFMRNQ